jgi:hypothetical protein
MVGIEDFIFGDKVIRAKTDVVKDSDKANFYYSANFYIDSEYIGHAGVSVGNGEIELYTCGNLEVVSDMREQKLGPLIVAKVFFAAAEEARNRNLIAPAWISATFDIASRKDYGGDDDVERDVSRTVGLLERLGLRRYQTEFKAGKLPDADLQQLMEKHSARNPDEWITFYARLSDLRKIVTERRGQSTVSNVSSASPSAGKVARAMPDDPLARDLDEKTETAIIETSLKDADHSSGFDENRSTLAALASAA